MALPSNFKSKSGKQSVISSFNTFLTEQIVDGEIHDGSTITLSGGKEFWWFFDYPLASLLFPSISINEVGLFTKASKAFGRLLGHDSSGVPVKGEENQTLIEINCWAKDTASQANGTRIVRELRDKVMYTLLNAGEFDEITDQLVIPKIDLIDFTQPSEPVIGTIRIDRADNAIDEKYIVDAVDQNIKRYRLLVRIFWFELT